MTPRFRRHTRRSIRLQKWNYADNAHYFVTICSHERDCIFGHVTSGRMKSNRNGEIAQNVWNALPGRFPVAIDAFQIMPNHIHGIITMGRVGVSFMKPHLGRDESIGRDKSRPYGDAFDIAKSHRHMGLIKQSQITLGHVIRHFKAKCSFEIHKSGFNQKIWQRNYYEHIIRNERDLIKIRKYIQINPLIWEQDKNHPTNLQGFHL